MKLYRMLTENIQERSHVLNGLYAARDAAMHALETSINYLKGVNMDRIFPQFDALGGLETRLGPRLSMPGGVSVPVYEVKPSSYILDPNVYAKKNKPWKKGSGNAKQRKKEIAAENRRKRKSEKNASKKRTGVSAGAIKDERDRAKATGKHRSNKWD